MPPGNENDEKRMFAKRSRLDVEELLEEKRQMLKNTRVFLQLICVSEESSRRYLEEMEAKLASDVRRLEKTLHSSEEPPAEPEPEK